MKKIHFAAANGFPALSYEYLFSKMDPFEIDFINIIGHKPSKNKSDLVFLKNEIVEHIEASFTQPVIGIGHSSGAAATMLAAAEHPELFDKVILIDPPLFSIQKRFMLGVARKLGLWRRIGPVKKALNRRSYFKDKQQAFNYWKNKPLFRTFHEECFASYVKHGLEEQGDEVALTFSSSVEADIFQNLVIKFPKKMEHIKATLLYANEGDLLWKSDLDWWRKAHPNFELIGFKGHHLFPLEQPDKTAIILKQLCLAD